MSRNQFTAAGRRRPVAAVAAIAAPAAAGLLLLAACGGSPADSNSATPQAGSAGTDGASGTGSPSGTITVFAAASLQESFTRIGKDFEAANPGTEVAFSFGPSSGLARQITSGAPADVFASASQSIMTQVADANAAENPTTFAKNVLEIAVPPDNPGKVESLGDLAEPKVKVALCQEQVPCGTVSAELFEKTGLDVTPVTRENDVKAVLTKVQLGEVDAGLVYATDVKASGDKVKGIALPPDTDASTSYPVAVLTDAPNKQGAQAFVDYVLSPEGAAVIADAGFAAP